MHFMIRPRHLPPRAITMLRRSDSRGSRYVSSFSYNVGMTTRSRFNTLLLGVAGFLLVLLALTIVWNALAKN